jgi:tetratricopeptide (TPR) repeat protein
LFLEQGEVQESLRLYKEVARISQDIGFGQGLAYARRSLGEILLATNQPTEALSSFLASAEVFAELGESESEAEIWEKVAMIYQQFLRDGQKGFTAWEKVRELRQQINDLRGELEALQQMGQLARELDDSESQALEYLYEAQTIAGEIGDRAKEGELLNTMGIIEWRQGEYQNALLHYQEALEIYEELGDLAGAGLMLNSIGVTLRYLGRYDEARNCLRQAVLTNRQAGQKQFEGYALAIVGDIYRDQGKHEQALHYYRASLDIRRTIGDRRGEGWMLHALAQEYALLNSLPQARECVIQALAIAEECTDEEMRCACIKLQEQLAVEI